jgi:hypothetical protein
MTDQEIKKVVMNAAEDLKNEIVKKINSNIPPPNAPSTIERKTHGKGGKTKTLQDTGNLWTSIDFRELSDGENDLEIEVGIFNEEVAKYAIANEYGSVRTVQTKNKDNEDEMHQGYSVIVIPERSFMRSAYDENIEKIYNELSAEISDIVLKKMND